MNKEEAEDEFAISIVTKIRKEVSPSSVPEGYVFDSMNDYMYMGYTWDSKYADTNYWNKLYSNLRKWKF